VDESTAETRMFLRFVGSLSGLTAYRTEWAIFGEQEWLAGSIDFVAETALGRLVLFDWKRSRNLRAKYTNRWRRMKTPLAHLADCAGAHYRLELNCYRYTLENTTA
jgi:hypothetical protein